MSKNTQINWKRLKRYYATNKYSRTLTVLTILLLLVVLFLFLQVISQKNNIQWLEKGLKIAGQQAGVKGLASDVKVEKFCDHPHPNNDFDSGPLYCGARLTGKINVGSEGVGTKFGLIRGEVSSKNALGGVKRDPNDAGRFTIPDKEYFECVDSESYDTSGKLGEFMVVCRMRTLHAYYRVTDY